MARLLHGVFWLRNRLPGRKGFVLIFTGGIGDLVSFSPAIRALAQRHPKVPIRVLVKDAPVGVFLRSCPHVDAIVELDIYETTRQKWWHMFKALWRIAWRCGCKTTILTMGGGWIPEYRIWGLLLVYASGARRRIILRDECGPWQHAPDPVRRLPLASEIVATSQLQRTDRFLEFFRKADLIDETAPAATEAWISQQSICETTRLDERFARGHDGRPIVLVFPGVGSGRGKLWPPGRYVKVVNFLVATYRAHVFVDGWDRDRLYCKAIAAVASTCENLAGRHSEGALCALIQRADLVIASDSGPIHIAGAAGTPAIAIFGPTDPRLWAPRSAQVTVLRRSDCPPCDLVFFCPRGLDFPCTREVQVSDVIEACQRILLNPPLGISPGKFEERPAGT